MVFWQQFKRRNVFKVGAAYLTVAWLIAQAASLLEASLNLHAAFDTVIVRLLILGFPIALVLAWIFELTPQGIRITRDEDLTERGDRPNGRVLDFVIIGALSLAVVFLIVDNYVLTESSPPGASPALGEERVVEAVFGEQQAVIPNKIAILPPETLGGAEDPSGVADGIYVDLFDELRNIGIELVGRRTMQRYAGSAHTYGEIAAENRAEFVMELVVQSVSDEIRINATLYALDGPAETVRWTTAFNDEFSAEGLLNLRASVGKTLAEQIGVELLPTAARLSTNLTASNEALTQYLVALPFLGNVTEENAARCLAPIEQAVLLDSGFKEAWYNKGRCHLFRAARTQNISLAENQSAVASLMRALEIDESYSDAAYLLATVHGSMGDWPAAGQAWLAASDGDTRARNENAFGFLAAIGHTRAALEILLGTFARDPASLNDIAMSNLQRLLDASGDMQGSDQVFQLGQATFDPWPSGRHGRLMVLMGRARQGRIDEAQVAEYARDAYSSLAPPWFAGLLEVFDDDEATVSFLRRWVANFELSRFANSDIASHAAYRGQAEMALEALKGAADGLGVNWNFVWNPLFEEVRQLDTFRDHMRESGMFDVWKAVGFPDLCEPVGSDDFRCV